MFQGTTIVDLMDLTDRTMDVADTVQAYEELGIEPTRIGAATHKRHLDLRAKHDAAELHTLDCRCYICKEKN